MLERCNYMNIISHEDAIEIVRKTGISYIADLDNISYLRQHRITADEDRC